MRKKYYSLVYRSTVSDMFSQSDLVPLLKEARCFNAAYNITGVLLMKDQTFLQYLEGDKEAVKGLFASIARDARHHSISVVLEGEIEERVFSDWSMAFEYLSTTFESIDPDVDVFVRSPGWSKPLDSVRYPSIEILRDFMCS